MQRLSDLAKLRNKLGIYVLVISIEKPITIHMGRTGKLIHLHRSKCFYIGSAGGPGGLYARIKRHLSKTKKVHWHIDYLTTASETRIERVYACINTHGRRAEELLADCLYRKGLSFVRGFGSTDDRNAPSHLYCKPLEGSDGRYIEVEECLEAVCEQNNSQIIIVNL